MRERVEVATPFTLRKPAMVAEVRSWTPTSGKRGIKDMVKEVVEGKKRKLGYRGIPFDPEEVRGKGMVVGLKLGVCCGRLGLVVCWLHWKRQDLF